jgi:hypothetical protein
LILLDENQTIDMRLVRDDKLLQAVRKCNAYSSSLLLAVSFLPTPRVVLLCGAWK